MGCETTKTNESSELKNQPYLELNSKYKIPQYGFGVYEIKGDEATEKACLSAFEIGIRHIDTAHAYENERGVGSAIKKKWNSKISNIYYFKIVGFRLWRRCHTKGH